MKSTSLKVIFLEGLTEFILHSIPSYWESEKNATVHDFGAPCNMVNEDQQGSCKTDAPRNNVMMENRRGNNGRRGGHANNIESSVPSSII